MLDSLEVRKVLLNRKTPRNVIEQSFQHAVEKQPIYSSLESWTASE